MKKFIQLLIFINFLFAFSYTLAQSRVDSLKHLLAQNINNAERANILFEMGDALINTNPDSSITLYNQGWIIITGSNSDSLSFLRRKAEAMQKIAKNYRDKGRLYDAISTFQKASQSYNILNDTLRIAQCHIGMGNTYFRLGNFDTSLEQYFNSLKLYEKLKDQIGVADCYNNIGSVYKELNDFDKAIDYHNKSVTSFEKLLTNTADTVELRLIKRGLSYGYNNIGVIYWNKNQNEKAIEHYKKSMAIKLELNDQKGAAMAYNNIAIVYATTEDYRNAIRYFQKSFDVYSRINAPNGLTMVNGNLAYLNILLADEESNTESKQTYLKNAIDYATKSIEIAKEIGALPYHLESTGYLSLAYAKLGNYKLALKYSNEYSVLQTEIFNEEKANALAETVSKYEAEKKQLQLENIEKENLLFQKRIDYQRIIIFSSTFVILLLGAFGILLFQHLNRKKRDNQQLTQQNEEILQQKEEIQSQVDELDAQRKEIEQLYLIAIERRNILEKQRENINGSIRYAQFIQNAVLPDLETIFDRAGIPSDSFFIMYKAKDVVSGDFYWATQKDDWLIVTVADCTGHGVPGALMSMLGVSFLNEIVVKNNNTSPAKILDELRSHVISALKQTNQAGTQRDGMEMSILAINVKEKECVWAGANNPLWIARKNITHIPIEKDYPKIQEFKPDFMPVAAHIKMQPYTNHTIHLDEGDRLFLFSDGYGDQFGGPEGKKFNMYSAFKRLISHTSELPMQEQLEELEENFSTWVNFGGSRYEQTDDVTIMGIMI